MSFNDNGYSQLGNSTAPLGSQATTTRGTYAFNDVWTRVIGTHTLKAGFEWRKAGTAIHQANNQGGTFTFNADTTGNSDKTLCPDGCPGDAMASFYLGAVGGASASYYNVHATYPRQIGYAAHLGDSWRVSPKLTLNYSLRWDYIAPFTEKNDHLAFFDPNGLNPGTGSDPSVQLKGRLAFAGSKWGAASYGAEVQSVKWDAFERSGVSFGSNEGGPVHRKVEFWPRGLAAGAPRPSLPIDQS